MKLEKLFRNLSDPPSAFRTMPFHIWNAVLEETGLRRQIKILHEKCDPADSSCIRRCDSAVRA